MTEYERSIVLNRDLCCNPKDRPFISVRSIADQFNNIPYTPTMGLFGVVVKPGLVTERVGGSRGDEN
jgi:hypothetical protein